MRIDGSFYSAAGSRDRNEDAAALEIWDDGALAVVADGVGGSVHGDVAASVAVRVLTRELKDAPVSEDALEQSVLSAHREIRSGAEAGFDGQTTICAVWIGSDSAVAACVGDSRLYQFRGGQICFQSVDHTLAQLAVYAGEITPDALRDHPDRNKLIRALGSETPPRVDIFQLNLEPGDRFLLCSDGFWGKIRDSEMLRLIEKHTTAEGWLQAMQQVVTITEGDNHSAVAMMLTD